MSEPSNPYNYHPSVGATALFAALFGVSTAWHALQLATRRTWYFIPFLIGGLFETVGYAVRGASSGGAPDYDKDLYILETILILLAPAFYAASIYMVLARLIMVLDAEKHALIPRKWTTGIFVSGDVVSFIVQATGGGLQSSSQTDNGYKAGQNIVVTGLFIQILVFSLFIVVTSLIHYHILIRPTRRSRTIQVPWRSFFYVLYAVSVLIMVRSIFRVAEYIQGREGELMSKEVYFYVLDTVLMFFVSVILNFFYPSRVLPRSEGKDYGQELGSESLAY